MCEAPGGLGDGMPASQNLLVFAAQHIINTRSTATVRETGISRDREVVVQFLIL